MSELGIRARFDEAAKSYQIAQEWGEWKDVYPLVEELAPKRVLELGSYYGGWIYAIAPACPKGALLVSIDNNAEPSRLQRMLHICGQLHNEGKTFRFHVGDSRSPGILDAARREMPEVDLLHIDGDHEYAACRADWDNYAPMVRKGGLVIIHDIHGEPGPNRLWHEVTPAYPNRWHFFVERDTPLMGTGVIRP